MNILAWLNPARWLMLLTAVAALTLGYFAWADHIGDKREATVRAAYAVQAQAADDARAAIAAPIAEKQIVVQEKIRTVFKTIKEQVNVYVPQGSCPLPGGYRVLHDAAANGELPDPARIPDAAPVASDVATETTVANYGACHETAARLTGLQDWVRAQQALTGSLATGSFSSKPGQKNERP